MPQNTNFYYYTILNMYEIFLKKKCIWGEGGMGVKIPLIYWMTVVYNGIHQYVFDEALLFFLPFFFFEALSAWISLHTSIFMRKWFSKPQNKCDLQFSINHSPANINKISRVIFLITQTNIH